MVIMFTIEECPFIGASPDAYVFDLSSVDQFSLAEIKCPYKYSYLTPIDESKQLDFYCKLATQLDKMSIVELKHTHPYYAQIQGQPAVTERKWSNYVIFTSKGISVKWIENDREF